MLVASVLNPTKRPSAEATASSQEPFSAVPTESRLTTSVTPVWRSWTKTPPAEAGFETRSSELLLKATMRPSAEIVEYQEESFPSLPLLSTLTSSVTPVSRSWTKTSIRLFVSPGTKLYERLLNVTQRPSPEMQRVCAVES